MTLPYRTRRALSRLAATLLILLLVAVVVWLVWFVWLDRYVVYTRDGAQFRFDLSAEDDPIGEVAKPPENETISIFINSGENSVNTSTELTQLIGYYADEKAIEEDLAEVRSQIESLPNGTPVMLDMKNIKGEFHYSTGLPSPLAGDVDIAAMDSLIEYLQDRDLYTIARIPAFRDYHYGLNNVSDGIFHSSGGYLWQDDTNCYWLNPERDGTLTYLTQIVNELKELGFDEVVLTDFTIPVSDNIMFSGDRSQVLSAAAAHLTLVCATDRFAVSFVSDAGFALPEGRSRLYMTGVAAADAAATAAATGLADPAIRLVFLTDIHDTRFDDYGVLRPLSTAHFE